MMTLAATPAMAEGEMNANTPPPPFPPPAIVTLPAGVSIRPYHPTADIEPSAHHANNPRIAQWMTNGFPHPYTLESAKTWNAFVQAQSPTLEFVIAKDDVLIGGIGLKPLFDIYMHTMVVGYWIGEEHWGRGIGKQVVKAFTSWAFKEFPAVARVEAEVSEGNLGSEKVLLGCGYVFEGMLRKRVCKNGVFLNSKYFATLREEWKD